MCPTVYAPTLRRNWKKQRLTSGLDPDAAIAQLSQTRCGAAAIGFARRPAIYGRAPQNWDISAPKQG